MRLEQVHDEIRLLLSITDKFLKGKKRDDAISAASKRIVALGTVSRQLSEIVVKSTMITGSTDNPKIKEYAGDCMAAASKISGLLGLGEARELTLELTRMLDEHPEGWEGPCECPGCIQVSD